MYNPTKRILAVLLVLLWPATGLAATLASDTFTGTDGTQLPTYNSNWANFTGCCYNNMVIRTNAVEEVASSGNIYTGVSFPENQWTEATVSNVADKTQALVLNGSTSVNTGYLCGIDSNNTGHNRYLIDRYSGGTRTNLWTHASQTMTAGDVVRCERNGSNLTLKVNGTDISGAVTDGTPLTGGSPGLSGRHDAAALILWDTWSGGDFASAGNAFSIRRGFE